MPNLNTQRNKHVLNFKNFLLIAVKWKQYKHISALIKTWFSLQTSHHLSFMMYLLGTHPEVQNNVYQEISQYVTGDGPVTATDMGKMSYLKAVDKEVHR